MKTYYKVTLGDTGYTIYDTAEEIKGILEEERKIIPNYTFNRIIKVTEEEIKIEDLK